MKSSKNLVRILTVFTSIGMFACASAIQRVDLPAGTDPQPKITETEARINGDRAKQFDLLSPDHFKDAQNALNDARKKSEKGEPSNRILEDIGQSMAHLQIVEDNGQKNAAALATVLTARTAAKSAGAATVVTEEFNSTDKQLRKFGNEIEDGEFHPDSAQISKLEGRYTDLELSALKTTHLGEARALIEKAENDGAKNDAPESYRNAQVQFDSASRTIEANRHNPETFRPSVQKSVKSAQKLDQVLKTMKDAKTSETAAVQIYDQREQLAATQASFAASQASLQNAEQVADAKSKQAQAQEQNDHQNIQALQGQNQQYADKEALNQKIEKIKAEFEPSEADVLRDGNKIIIRLKSMKFSSARFDLTSSSLDTLQKVKAMITAVNINRVIVEGHTDSVGTEQKNMELSQKRAEAIKKYFVSEKTLPENQVEAKGFGYEKPLTTNKTKEGRATNRRVDVVIETAATI